MSKEKELFPCQLGEYLYHISGCIKGVCVGFEEVSREPHLFSLDSYWAIKMQTEDSLGFFHVFLNEIGNQWFTTEEEAEKHHKILKNKKNDKQKIKIKYFSKELKKIQKIIIGDWIDLRSCADVEFKQGEYKLIPLGVGMELPGGYEAHIVPRSSTFRNFGIIQTNSNGIIDESYRGNNDQWFFPAFALRDTKINFDDRICQFRIFKKMEEVEFEEVEELQGENRGGIGSTGIK